MTRPQEKNLVKYKPGQSGNPKGGAIVPPEIRMLRSVTQKDVAQIGQMIILGDVPSLEEVIENARHKDPAKRPSTLQVMIASGAIRAIKKGDVTTLNALLDRFVGRIPVHMSVSGPGGGPIRIQPVTAEEAEEKTREILARLNAKL